MQQNRRGSQRQSPKRAGETEVKCGHACWYQSISTKADDVDGTVSKATRLSGVVASATTGGSRKPRPRIERAQTRLGWQLMLSHNVVCDKVAVVMFRLRSIQQIIMWRTFSAVRHNPMETVVVGLVLVGVVAAFGNQLFGRRLGHYDNSVRARTLTVGMTRSTVIDLLGDPIAEENGWTYFQSSPTAAHLRVRFDNGNRLVKVDPASTQP